MEVRQEICLTGMIHPSPIPTAARVGPLLISGLIRGKDIETNEMPAEPERQAELLMKNIAAVMEAAGGTLDQIVKVRVYVKERAVREHLDPAWIATFPDEHNRPARHVYEQKLGQKDAHFEAEIEAYIA